MNIFDLRRQIADLQREIESLREQLAESERVKMELYFLHTDLIERMRVEPPIVHLLRREGQVKG
jgi:hypothetical protein